MDNCKHGNKVDKCTTCSYEWGYDSGKRDGIREGLERAAKACLDEKVSGETGTDGDIGYNHACDHCAQAIRDAAKGLP